MLMRLSKSYLSHYSSGLKKVVWIGILIGFIEAFFIGIYYFLSIYFINVLSFDILTSSLLISSYGLGTILGAYIGGKSCDLFPPGIICSICLFLQGVIFFLMSWVNSQPLLFIIMFIMGLVSYAFVTANFIWLINKTDNEENKIKIISLLSVINNFSLALSATIISVLSVNSFITFFYVGGFLLGVIGIWFFYIEKNQKQTRKLEVSNTSLPQTSGSLLLSKRLVILNFVCTFLMGFIVFQTGTTYSLYIQNLFPAYGTRGLGALLSLNCLIVIFAQTPLLNMFSSANKTKIMGAGALLIGLGMGLLNHSYFFSIAVLSCIIYTVGEMLFFSVSQLLCYESAPEGKKGTIVGTYRTIYASTRVVAPTLGGAIFSYAGSSFLWYFCAFLGLTCFWCCFQYKVP